MLHGSQTGGIWYGKANGRGKPTIILFLHFVKLLNALKSPNLIAIYFDITRGQIAISKDIIIIIPSRMIYTDIPNCVEGENPYILSIRPANLELPISGLLRATKITLQVGLGSFCCKKALMVYNKQASGSRCV